MLAPKARRAVRENLKRVVGKRTDGKRLRRMERRVFINAAKNYYELSCVPRLDPYSLQKLINVHGWENLTQALERKKGVIIATAHLGNIELVIQAIVAHSIKVTVLAEPLQPPELFELFVKFRQSKGLSFLPVGFGGLKSVVQALRRGEVVAIACDRDIQKNGLKMSFMGEEATVPTGAIDLALRTGAAVIPAFSVRNANNHFDVYIETSLELTTNGSRQKDVSDNLVLVIRAMEKYIRAYPEQWVVFEPLWTRKN